ncbi:MAG TPA: hypothetical protein VKK79_06735 [Candidatus Lokiarchaeia archaeon]|nr:hypothetical protein [Candidatus Lokiarchaeia archaeon]
MKNPTSPLTSGDQFILRITFPGFWRGPIYVAVADATRQLGESLGSALELVHASLLDVFVTQKGELVDVHAPVSCLVSVPFYAGNERWVVAEIALKSCHEIEDIEISTSGNLPVPSDFNELWSSESELSDDLLLERVEEVMLLKSYRQKSVLKRTVVGDVLRMVQGRWGVGLESERVESMIDSVAKKLGHAATPARVIFARKSHP